MPSAAVVQKFTIANVAVNNLEFQVTGNHDGDNGNAGLLGQSFLERWG